MSKVPSAPATEGGNSEGQLASLLHYCFDAGLAMQNLKKSLQIPDRMGWNGDPCAPLSWDAWDGVSCTLSNDGKSIVVSRMWVHDITNMENISKNALVFHVSRLIVKLHVHSVEISWACLIVLKREVSEASNTRSAGRVMQRLIKSRTHWDN